MNTNLIKVVPDGTANGLRFRGKVVQDDHVIAMYTRRVVMEERPGMVGANEMKVVVILDGEMVSLSILTWIGQGVKAYLLPLDSDSKDRMIDDRIGRQTESVVQAIYDQDVLPKEIQLISYEGDQAA